jgi:hypothetical protein
MFLDHLILTAWRALRGVAQPLPEPDTAMRNYSLSRLGERDDATRGPIARLERSMEAFVVTAARVAAGV